MPASNTYEPIATTTLTSAVPSVTFGSIPQTYTDLILVVAASPTSNAVAGYMQVNSDTGSNYSMSGMRGNGTNVASYRISNNGNFFFDYAGDTNTGTITVSTIHFLNYSSTNVFKTNLVRQSNQGDAVELLAQLWRSTSAITSINLFWSTGNFAIGSTFTLYGIKAA
jgi:hypothetical protein